MEEIDLISIKKSIADLEDEERKKARDCVSLSKSTDPVVAHHKEYWESLAARHTAKADLFNDIWKGL